MNPATQKALVAACIRGDESAWNEFIERYSNFIYFIINKTLKGQNVTYTEEDSDDIYMNVCSSLLEHDGRLLRQYDARFSLTTWLGRITKCKCIDYLRKRNIELIKSSSLPDPDGDDLMQETLPDPASSPDDAAASAEMIENVQKALAKLSPRDQIVLKLAYYEGKSYKEIASVLRVAVNSVGSLICRAEAKLAEALELSGPVSPE